MNDRTQLLRNSAQSATTVIDGAAHRVLRNTYMLLSLCLGFSAAVAAGAVSLGLPGPGIIITLVGFYGLLYLIHRNRDSGTGVALLFAMILGAVIVFAFGAARILQLRMVAGRARRKGPGSSPPAE